MQYLMLVYGNESSMANTPKEVVDVMMGEYLAYTKDIHAAGVCSASEMLHPTAAATTVRAKDGKPLITHGPFAETKEQLGGYYVLDCRNLDEALEWAAKCPGARFGSIEVRPIVDLSQMP